MPPSPPSGGSSYPHAGTPGFAADTPGTVNPSPGGMGYRGHPYAAPSPGYAPASYAASAGTPGMYAAAGTPALAGTPGMYAAAGTPGVFNDAAAATPGGGGYGAAGGGAAGPAGVDYSLWIDAEVVLASGERAALRSVDGGVATVSLGSEAADKDRTVWIYPPGAASRTVPVGEVQLATGTKGRMRIVSGELIGQEGVVVGIDGGDGIVKLGADIKIIQLSHLAMLAEAAVPPPAAPT